MQSFQVEFQELEDLHLLDVSNNAEIWALHCTHMQAIQQKLDAFEDYYDNHPLRTERHKNSLQLYASSNLLHEVRRMQIDPECMNALNEWLSNDNDILLHD